MGLWQTKMRLSASLGTTRTFDRSNDTSHWVDGEINESVFDDLRLGKRFRELLIRMGGGIGESIPLACQDWANTKAAYRFFANKRVPEGDILSGHFDATRARFDAARGTVLLLQDTTEFTYQRARPELVGFTKDINSGKDKKGRYRHHTVCGILMPSSPP